MNWYIIGYQGARLAVSILFGLIDFVTTYAIAGLAFWPSFGSAILVSASFWKLTP